MMSSGTTGNNPSKIMLDKKTSARQTKVLAKIINQYIGSKRLPMIIIDNESTIKNRNKFSAIACWNFLAFQCLEKINYLHLMTK